MLALLGAAPYSLLHALGREIDDPGTYEIITLCVVGLPLLLGLLCLGRLMRVAGASTRDTAWLLAAAAFGTLVLPYSLVLNQHGAAAGFVIAALLQVQRGRYTWAGALLGLATAVDLTALFFGLAVLLPVARAGALTGVVRYGVGALPALVAHFGINHAIVGDFMPLGLHFEAFQYAQSPFLLMELTADVDSGGPMSLLSYAWGATFGASGLFSHHPVLLLAVTAGSLERDPRRRAGAAPPCSARPHSRLLSITRCCSAAAASASSTSQRRATTADQRSGCAGSASSRRACCSCWPPGSADDLAGASRSCSTPPC